MNIKQNKILSAALTLIALYLIVTINHINTIWTVTTVSHLLYRRNVIFG